MPLPTDPGTFPKAVAALGAGGSAGIRMGLPSATAEAATGVLAQAQLPERLQAASVPPPAPPDKPPTNVQLPQPVPCKLGWALVGLGRLAVEDVLPAFGHCRLPRPVAFVSRHPDKARQLARVYDVQKTAMYNYDDLDRIAADKRIDVVYIMLPNSMHAEYTIWALGAGTPGKIGLANMRIMAAVERAPRTGRSVKLT